MEPSHERNFCTLTREYIQSHVAICSTRIYIYIYIFTLNYRILLITANVIIMQQCFCLFT